MKKAKNLPVIGSKITVDFPELSLFGVPAKVDTGADSSSIWASNVAEEDGEVSFELFDISSSFYTGERIAADSYSVRIIKNSFGVSEYRYKISMTIALSGKRFKARFTLSNRKNNRYPILIGRQTLKNRFVVDVSKPIHANKVNIPKKVLVLVNKGNEKIKSFYQEAEQRQEGKVVFEVRRYKDLVFTINDNNAEAVFVQEGVNIRSFDLIYFKTRIKNAEIAAAVASIAKQENVPFFDKVTQVQPTDKKAHQFVILALNGISLPATICMDISYWNNNFKMLESVLGLPFIFKDNDGKKGRNNFLIKNKNDFRKALDVVTEQNQEIQMVAQRFIPNDGYYRIVVMGRRMAIAMYRNIDQKSSHLYKRERDGLPVLLQESDLPIDVIKLAVQATESLDLDVAGVDLIKDKQTGVWYCLEVNNSPQLVSGAFVTEKMNALAKFFLEEMDR